MAYDMFGRWVPDNQIDPRTGYPYGMRAQRRRQRRLQFHQSCRPGTVSPAARRSSPRGSP